MTRTPDSAMGQAESHEMLRQRSAAIRNASRQATEPRKRGTLPRVSGGPYTVPAQRRLNSNVLSGEGIYDLPSDEDEALLRNRHKPLRKSFSPLKRHVRQSSRTLEEAIREDQVRASAQLVQEEELANEDQLNEDEEEEVTNQRRKSPRKRRDAPLAAQDLAQGNMYRDFFSDAQVRAAQISQDQGNSNDIIVVATSSPASAADESDEVDQEAADQPERDANAEKARRSPRRKGRPSKLAPESSRQSPKKPGRPRKQVDHDEDRQNSGRVKPLADPQRATKGKRKRGSNSEEIEERPQSAGSMQERSHRGNGGHQADGQSRKATATRESAKQVDAAKHDVSSKTTDARKSKRQKQSSVRSQAALSARDKRSDTGRAAQREETRHGADDLEGENRDLQTNHEVEDYFTPQQEDQDEEEASEEDDEYSNDSEDHSASEKSSDGVEYEYRLYGRWELLRTMVHEAAKHRRAKVRINDDVFKQAIQSCNDAVATLGILAKDASTSDHREAFLSFKNAMKNSRDACGKGSVELDFTDEQKTKKRGYHIYKHLLPALTRVLKAAIVYYEQLDIVCDGKRQISLAHLRTILDFTGNFCDTTTHVYENYRELSKPIKQNVHGGIALPLRELHTLLDKTYRAELAKRKQSEDGERMARDMAARDKEQERLERPRKALNEHRTKWQRLNMERIVIADTFDSRKLRHLRSCPSSLIEVDEFGGCYLNDRARAQDLALPKWKMRELEALEDGLRRYADAEDSGPVDSMVFDCIVRYKCRPGGELAERNLLEIVVTASDLREFWVASRRKAGLDVELWIERIPRWLRPDSATIVVDDD